MLNCHFIVFVCVFLTLIEGAHELGLGGLGAEGMEQGIQECDMILCDATPFYS